MLGPNFVCNLIEFYEAWNKPEKAKELVTEAGLEELVSYSRTYCKNMSLPQRSGCVLDTPGWIDFGMARSGAAPLPEVLHFVLAVETVEAQS